MIKQANQYLQQGQFTLAENLYRQLLQKNANDIDALWGLGKVALAVDSYQQAYNIFHKCISLRADIYVLWLSFAQACEKLAQIEEAEVALKQAHTLAGENLAVLLPLAIFYCQSGEYDQAKNYFAKIDAIAPMQVQAFCLKVRIALITEFEETAQVLLSQLTGNAHHFSWQESVSLHYAFASLYQNQKNYEQAFKHFCEANKLQLAKTTFSVDDMKGYFQQLESTFDSAYFAQITSSDDKLVKNNKLTPIFIVGQPRSGSTLLEQLLIGHSDIASGGELPFMAGDIAQGIFQITGQHFPQGAAILSKPEYAQQRQNLADHYLTKLQSLAPNAPYIIDKMPANYQSIALIKLLMPQAKIIHITRDAMDVSWSIYSNQFESLEPYFCSLSEIGKYHHAYQKVMSHWQLNIPEFIHTLSYSDLVSAPEQTITAVLNFCGLNYQSNCLEINQQAQHINTLSDVQLRSGIVQNRAKKWQPYQQYLSALFEALT